MSRREISLQFIPPNRHAELVDLVRSKTAYSTFYYDKKTDRVYRVSNKVKSNHMDDILAHLKAKIGLKQSDSLKIEDNGTEVASDAGKISPSSNVKREAVSGDSLRIARDLIKDAESAGNASFATPSKATKPAPASPPPSRASSPPPPSPTTPSTSKAPAITPPSVVVATPGVVPPSKRELTREDYRDAMTESLIDASNHGVFEPRIVTGRLIELTEAEQRRGNWSMAGSLYRLGEKSGLSEEKKLEIRGVSRALIGADPSAPLPDDVKEQISEAMTAILESDPPEKPVFARTVSRRERIKARMNE